MKILKAGALYFAIVFAAGFALGAIRVMLVVPRFGTRAAELIETPVMVGVSFIAARWVVGRFERAPSVLERLGVGIVGLVMLVGAEFTFVLPLQGKTITEYLASRDPVSGMAYVVALVLFALMPLWVSRR